MDLCDYLFRLTIFLGHMASKMMDLFSAIDELRHGILKLEVVIQEANLEGKTLRNPEDISHSKLNIAIGKRSLAKNKAILLEMEQVQAMQIGIVLVSVVSYEVRKSLLMAGRKLPLSTSRFGAFYQTQQSSGGTKHHQSLEQSAERGFFANM